VYDMSAMAKKRKPPPTPEPASRKNPWPARLKAIRVRYQLTQTEAAQRIGTVLRTWQNWEYGRRQPSTTTARLIELTFPMK
jgi:DNA-binding transcriptional regulator YiaG